MSEPAGDAAATKAALAAAKRGPVAFAFAPGTSDADGRFVANVRKTPEKLAADLKTIVRGAKIGHGRFTLDGNTMTIDVLKDVAGLDKHLKVALKSMGHSVSVVRANDPAEEMPETATSEPDDTSGASKTATTAALLAAGQEWDKARKSALSDLKALVDAIRTAVAADPDLDGAAPDLSGIVNRIKAFDGKLTDLLVEAAKAEASETRERLRKAARARLAVHAKALADPILREIDANPFSPTAFHPTFLGGLRKAQAALDA